jgi:hypothetical protein
MFLLMYLISSSGYEIIWTRFGPFVEVLYRALASRNELIIIPWL